MFSYLAWAVDLVGNLAANIIAMKTSTMEAMLNPRL
jgi:hypothetical protein